MPFGMPRRHPALDGLRSAVRRLLQGIEGISLACTFLDAGYGRLKYALFSAMFILITPIGIGAAPTPLYVERLSDAASPA